MAGPVNVGPAKKYMLNNVNKRLEAINQGKWSPDNHTFFLRKSSFCNIRRTASSIIMFLLELEWMISKAFHGIKFEELSHSSFQTHA